MSAANAFEHLLAARNALAAAKLHTQPTPRRQAIEDAVRSLNELEHPVGDIDELVVEAHVYAGELKHLLGRTDLASALDQTIDRALYFAQHATGGQ